MNINVKSRSVQYVQFGSYAKMAFASALVVFCAWFIGYLFNKHYPLTKFWVDILEYTGYVLWGTALAELKIIDEAQTIESEQLYRKLQIFCSEVGIFVFVLSRSIVPILAQH